MREMECSTFQDGAILIQALGGSRIRVIVSPRRDHGYISVQVVADGFVVARHDVACHSKRTAYDYLFRTTRGLYSPLN